MTDRNGLGVILYTHTPLRVGLLFSLRSMHTQQTDKGRKIALKADDQTRIPNTFEGLRNETKENHKMNKI